MDGVYVLPSCSFNIHFNIILPSKICSFKWALIQDSYKYSVLPPYLLHATPIFVSLIAKRNYKCEMSLSPFNTGHFIMFCMITNIYNEKTKGPSLMELFRATGKLKKFFLTTREVRCVRHVWPGTHRTSLVVKKTFSVFLWLWTIPLK
jgi:hypothetical protein